MTTLQSLFRKSIIHIIIILLVVAFPFAAYAQETIPSDQASTETPTASTTTPAPTTPPPDPYVLNTKTGNYENSKYSWNPSTFQSTPKTTPEYSYNPNSGVWETPQHSFNPVTEEYVPNPNKTDSAVSDTSQQAMPSTENTNQSKPTSHNSFSSAQEQLKNPQVYQNASFKTPGYNNDAFFDTFYNASISNTIHSTANSGDAEITQNTIAGSALSGDATAIANLFNILQSSFSPGGSSQIGTFVANIDGDVVGDLTIDPSKIASSRLPISNGASNNDLKINVQNNAGIQNDIQLSATSGNANVIANTQAGDATTGTATAMANVVNMINSTIASGDSFLGMININGNFNGDILMPPNVLDYLLASSAPKTTVDLTQMDTSLNSNQTNNQTIANNINTLAESGSAIVSNNTTAASARTGSAETNVTILNLTGNNVISANSLLVFVNVLGKWVGVIVDAPEGSTSAAYAGGVSNTNKLNVFQDTEINAENNNSIINNISVAAKSGDALIEKNTLAGDASSGNAYAGVNLANIINSSFSLSDWFGVLFINVFGSWQGSFGIDTAAGNSNKPPSDTDNNSSNNSPPVIGFIPNSPQSTFDSNASTTNRTGSSQNNTELTGFYEDVEVSSNNDDRRLVALAGDTTSLPSSELNQTNTPSSSNLYWTIAFVASLLLLVGLAIERYISSRRSVVS